MNEKLSKQRIHAYPAAVLATVRRRRLLGQDDRVLAAVSAGPDSTALVAALVALRDAGELAAVFALHVDHQLRPGGVEDAACAAATCARLAVPFESVAVDVGSGNVQAAARRARYAALRAAAQRLGATRIATGHTRTDQAETVLLRLLRGAGARGLAAIPARRGIVIRPLLERARGEGIAYLRDLGLSWREDPTNATPRFARNRLRLGAWPELMALAPALEVALARTADLAREDERALAARARAVLAGRTRVDVGALRSEPVAVRRRIVRALWRAASGRPPLPVRQVEAVLGLLPRCGPGRVTLPGGLEAICRYGSLAIRPAPAPPPAPAPILISAPGRYAVPALGGAIVVTARDPSAIPWPLALRTRSAGDRFRPLGGAGEKKLKAWLIDRKVPRELRDHLVVVAGGRQVLAIPELGVVADGPGGLVVRLSAGP